MRIHPTLVAVLVQFASVASASDACCSALSQSDLYDKIFYPDDTTYNASITSYWAIQAQLMPNCIVRPSTPQDVSQVVKILVETNKTVPCQFAIRGGGHTVWPGAANIENGITMDLSLMNQTTYNENNSTASVGPGSRWVGVYQVLDQLGIAIPGGRAGSVGVAGLTLGGGNSFFAARYGLVCDNVANYEVVLGNGSIIDVNNKSNSDLFQALKGGSNNFGVVTRFDFYAFKQDKLWGGVVVYPNTTTAQQIPAFVNFNNHIADDPYGSVITFWEYSSFVGANVVVNAYEYTKPVVNAPPFQEYLSIPGNISSDMRLTNLSDLTAELEQAYDYRDIFLTLTFVNDQRVLQKAIDLHNGYIAELNGTAGGNWTIVTMFQPIPTIFSQHSLEKGGNVLGLDRATQNLVLFQINLAWQRPQDDGLFDSVGQGMVDQLDAYARSIGAHNDYIYLDYAYETQNPLASYGPENLAKIRAAAAKYDPQGVFQYMVPGGYKINAMGGQS